MQRITDMSVAIVMASGTSWKCICLEGIESWKMMIKVQREAKEEMEPKEFKGVEKE